MGTKGGNYRIFNLFHRFGVKVYMILVPGGACVNPHVDVLPYSNCLSVILGLLPGSRHFFRRDRDGQRAGYYVVYDPSFHEHGTLPQKYPQLYFGVGVHGHKSPVQEVKLRFNHMWDKIPGQQHLKWRAVVDGTEELASNVYISVPVETTADQIQQGDQMVPKWHITARGSLVWRGTDLYIV